MSVPKKWAFYNEIDSFAAQWIRNLIKANLITDGEVDERSIEDVMPDDVRPFLRVHAFAGIGVWDYALQRAGWPANHSTWTGSCPCQPFSAAGKSGGFADERHLWPSFFHLIEQCRPATVFGEQVASKATDAWIDLVQDDMEGVGYTFGAIPFPSAGVGAPHIRDRLYWVADSTSSRRFGKVDEPEGHPWDETRMRLSDEISGLGGMADATREQHNRSGCAGPGRWPEYPDGSAAGGMPHADSRQRERVSIVRGAECDGDDGRRQEGCCQPQSCSANDRMGDTQQPRLEGYAGHGNGSGGRSHEAGSTSATGPSRWMGFSDSDGPQQRIASAETARHGHTLEPTSNPDRSDPTNGFWRNVDWLRCRDGKWRPVESRSEPMADGLAARMGYVRAGDGWSLLPLIEKGFSRVGRLKGYGNAINAEAATTFIEAAMKCIP